MACILAIGIGGRRSSSSSIFNCMGAISTSYNNNPTQVSRALGKNHDGFCITGGGGGVVVVVVILKELECAKACCAKIYSNLVG